MVARPRGKLDVAQSLQLAPHRRYVERHRKLLIEPLNQVDQPPANDAVDRRDRALLDHLHKRPALGIGEDRALAGSLAVEQAVRAARVEPQDPVSHNLKGHAPDPGSLAPAAPIVNLSQCQQPPRLVRAFR